MPCSPPAPISFCPPCEDGTGCLITFTDLPTDLNIPTDYGGVNTDFLGSWHGLAIRNFYGIWGYPNASSVIDHVDRLTTSEPSPGVIYSDMADTLVFIESVDSRMQASCPSMHTTPSHTSKFILSTLSVQQNGLSRVQSRTYIFSNDSAIWRFVRVLVGTIKSATISAAEEQSVAWTTPELIYNHRTYASATSDTLKWMQSHFIN